MVENAQRFNHVGDGNAAVPNQQEVFPILEVRRGGKIVRAEINPGAGFIEINDNELVVHANAATTCWFGGERFRDVFRQCGRKNGGDIAVRFLQIETADFAVGNAIHKDIGVTGHIGDRIENRPGRLVQERQRIKQRRCCLAADVVGHRLQ